MRVGEVLREVTWEQAIAEATEKLTAFAGDRFAFVCDTTSTLEDRQVFEKFTREVMKSTHFIEVQPSDRGVSQTQIPAGVEAALLTGAFVTDDALDTLEVLVIQDIYPTAASERADVVLPVAIFTEIDGSWLDGSGIRRPLNKACKTPGRARPEWQITTELGRAIGAADFGFEDVRAIGEQIDAPMAGIWVDRDTAPAAALDPTMRRTHFRGHCLAEKIRGLQDLSDV
jgi:predicted molibdopterin-dependent oxidoreductase YjgC